MEFDRLVELGLVPSTLKLVVFPESIIESNCYEKLGEEGEKL